MNILLTNDDGIDSEGIQKLTAALRSKGKYKITVIAPNLNRSGISHAVSLLNEPVKLSKLGEDVYSCSGYPVDCVIIAMLGPFAKPDLVLSGINRGENLGTDIVYSGTAAAARQASLGGIPALALSLAGGYTGNEVFYWDMAASWAADHLDELIAFWEKDTFVNVNIPNTPGGPDGFITAWPALKAYTDILKVMDTSDGDRWYFLEGEPKLTIVQPDSDCDVVSRNFVSVTSVYNRPIAKK
jgi:5'-nucleotidase